MRGLRERVRVGVRGVEARLGLWLGLRLKVRVRIRTKLTTTNPNPRSDPNKPVQLIAEMVSRSVPIRSGRKKNTSSGSHTGCAWPRRRKLDFVVPFRVKST